MNKLFSRPYKRLIVILQATYTLACMASWFGMVTLAWAASNLEESPEYAIKAAFLFKFGAFVEWPAAVFESASAPLIIGIVGEDPFGAAIEKHVKGRTVSNRQIRVIRSQRIDQINGEHILFISQSEMLRMDPILSKIKGRHVLTVAEFENPNIIIRFIVEHDKVRFDINLDQAHRVGLKPSSKLLSVARSVNGR